MKRAITPYHLGATLYLPANHKNLFAVTTAQKYPQARSVIIDFEDAIYEEDLQASTKQLAELLAQIPQQELLIFIRPRSIEHLHDLLLLEDIDKVDGFVLAKCDTQNMHLYFKELACRSFWVMPVLESLEIFDQAKLEAIKHFLLQHQEHILSLRFGGEDLSSYLGLKRGCEDILYDLYPLVQLLSSIVIRFKSAGFNITAPVFACFKNEAGFKRELVEDLKMGLFGKTVIHPDQINWAHLAYGVTKEDSIQAHKVLDKDAKAIMASDGMMLETIPHRRWAKGIILREELYGTL